MNEATVAPAPGSVPMRKPTTVARISVKRTAIQSAIVGHSSRKRVRMTGRSSVSSAFVKSSASAKRPIATTAKSNPPRRSAFPNAKRGVPLIESMPTVPRASPNAAATRPFMIERPARRVSVVRPRIMSAVFSSGPKPRANAVSGGASSMRPSTARVPAMKEAIAAIASAGPARPLRAIA